MQRVTAFVSGDLSSPYYNDLSAGEDVWDAAAATLRLRALVADRDRLNPVSVAQLGLVAWERRAAADWARIAHEAADALAAAIEPDGTIPYRFAMPHTYRIQAPWASAMAQGQAASLLLRASHDTRRKELADAAYLALTPLVEAHAPLAVETIDGIVLQEYPTTPSSHVLNGWIFALLGIHDGAQAELRSARGRRAAHAFAEGAATVAARIRLYETLGGWSLYDLYPHALPHVASPFYHRLHVELLRALNRLAPDPRLGDAIRRFERGAAGTVTTSVAVARKGAFRLVNPRGRNLAG